MRAGLFAAAVAISISIVGCGDDDSGSGRYTAYTDFDASFKNAECTYLATCGLFPDKATCMAAHLTTSTSYELSADLRAAIAAGTVLYNGNAVFECFDALATASCDKTDQAGRAPVLACFQFTRGTVGADGPCTMDEQCISNQCRINVADECAPGTCLGDTPPEIRIPMIGETCNSVVGCGAGSYCEQSTFQCTALKSAGAECVDGRECAYGLGCSGTPRTCKTLPGPNEGCAEGVCRDDGQRCIGAICKPLGLPGTMCASSSDCSPYFPCDFGTSMCKKLPSIGEACTSGNSRCFEEKSYCDSTTLRCVAAKPDGAMCTTSLQCESEECDFATSMCVSPGCSL